MTDYRSFIAQEEGFKNFPYKCSGDKLTIGIGRNLEDVGLSHEEVIFLYEADERSAIEGASSLVDEFEWLSDARKIALVSMVFQMGKNGVSKFKKMIAAINAGEFSQAANEMLDSRFAKQTPERAERQAEMMRAGKMP